MITLRALTLGCLLTCSVACAPAGSGANGGSSGAPVAEHAPVEARLARAEPTSLQRTISVTGSLFGEEQAIVAAKVPGRVQSVLHDVGDELEAGAALAQIERVDYELAVAERERAFEQALALLGLDEMPGEKGPIDGLPAVERARARAQKASARYKRGVLLAQAKEPLVSEQDLADLGTAADVARTEHRLAELEARAQLAELRTLAAQLATARQRLVDTLIVVPSGQRPRDREREQPSAPQRYSVAARRVGVGDYVAVGAPLFELVDSDPVELRVRVPEKYSAAVQLGQRATFRVEALREPVEGRVVRIQPLVDPRTRTFEARIEAPNPSGSLRVGSFARAEISSHVDPGALVVPSSAITTFAGVHKLFVVIDGVARERIVALGEELEGAREVLSGLAPGELYVVVPPPNLASGTPIRPAEAPR